MKLTFRIKNSTDLVFDYLSDVQKFVSVHPVITQIEHKGESRYLVHETLRFFGIPFRFKYPVTIESNQKDRVVTMRAIVMKLVSIDLRFILTPDNEGTIIDEEIVFKSLLPVKPIMQQIFKQQHTQLFNNIEAVTSSA